jgi:hypothetical protein
MAGVEAKPREALWSEVYRNRSLDGSGEISGELRQIRSLTVAAWEPFTTTSQSGLPLSIDPQRTFISRDHYRNKFSEYADYIRGRELLTLTYSIALIIWFCIPGCERASKRK